MSVTGREREGRISVDSTEWRGAPFGVWIVADAHAGDLDHATRQNPNT